MAQHPWGESHSESYTPAEIQARVENLPEEEKARLVQLCRTEIEKKEALPGKILSAIVGTVLGAVIK
jgi:hypothetical protein